MAKHRQLLEGQRLPQDWLDAIQEFLSTYVSGNFSVTLPTTTTVRVAASAGDGQVGIAINGKWRYIAANADAAPPGSLPVGTHPLFVAASDNSYTTNPTPPPTEEDLTDYSFRLIVKQAGSTPSGIGAEALYKQIGTVTWDGVKFTAVNVTVGPQSGSVWRGNPDISYTAGKVGIGTASPAFTLDVNGQVNAVPSADPAAYRVTTPVAASATTYAFGVREAADANSRFRIRADGQLEWGVGGASAADLKAYRAGAGILEVNGMVRSLSGGPNVLGFGYNPATAVGSALASTVAAEANARFYISVNGDLNWGPGGATPVDLRLSRNAAQLLRLDGQMVSVPGTVGFGAFLTQRNGDAQYRWYVTTDGTLNWGPGNAAADASMSRSGSGALLINSAQLEVAGTFFTDGYVIMMQGGARQWTMAWNETVNPDGGVTTLRVGTSGNTLNGNFAALTAAGAWVNGSSAASKENFETFGEHLAHDDVLAMVCKLPLHRYNPKPPRRPSKKHLDEKREAAERAGVPHVEHDELCARLVAIKHVSPTSEDFHKITGLGLDDKTIAPSDMAGLALVSVQGLVRDRDALRAEIADLRKRLDDLASAA